MRKRKLSIRHTLKQHKPDLLYIFDGESGTVPNEGTYGPADMTLNGTPVYGRDHFSSENANTYGVVTDIPALKSDYHTFIWVGRLMADAGNFGRLYQWGSDGPLMFLDEPYVQAEIGRVTTASKFRTDINTITTWTPTPLMLIVVTFDIDRTNELEVWVQTHNGGSIANHTSQHQNGSGDLSAYGGDLHISNRADLIRDLNAQVRAFGYVTRTLDRAEIEHIAGAVLQ